MMGGPTLTYLAPAVAFRRDQIKRLSEHASPYRYLLPARWTAMRGNCLAFCDEFGAETYRPG
jgi:hypothetical protein